jgi:polyhydroxybutyrate depolymerase
MGRATFGLCSLTIAACAADLSDPSASHVLRDHQSSFDRPTVFGGERPTTLRTPATLEDGKLYPLVVVLHAYGGSGDVQTRYFGLQSLPTDGEALVLAPDGTRDLSGQRFWDADPACCDFGNLNPDDVGYIGSLIDDVIATWPVDPQAVRIVGHSNGAFMAYRMACERADVVRAIASLAGGASSVAALCQPSEPVAVLHVHGTLDTVIPYNGGVGPGALRSVSQWAAHNGCGMTRGAGPTLDLETSIAGSETTTAAHVGCPSGGAVELWTMWGNGHFPVSGWRIGSAMMGWFGSAPDL